jgi:hypothetical protein
MPIQHTKLIPESLHHTCVIATWAAMPNGEVGTPVELGNFADRSVQITGVFGVGGNLRIEGSINGTDYAPLTDPQGNALDFTTPKIEAISELVRYVRPRVTAGDGTTSITVDMFLKGATR